MTNFYTPPTLTGYDQTPPSDNGVQEAQNLLKWSTHTGKIGDPLKNFSEEINTQLENAFAFVASTSDTIAELKAVDGGESPSGLLYVKGYYSAGDLGGGFFEYNPANSDPDNGYDVIAPTVGSGRYERILIGNANIKMAGAPLDGVTDDTPFINNCIDATPDGSQIDFPEGTYTLVKVSGTSPNDLAVDDGESQPDIPDDCAILIRDRTSLTLNVLGMDASISLGNAICFYKCDGCRLTGVHDISQTGVITTEQPSAVVVCRCLNSSVDVKGSKADGFYRTYFGLKNGLCEFNHLSAHDSNYYSIYMSGVLDVAVGGSAAYSTFKYTNFVRNSHAVNSRFGSFFLDGSVAENCIGFDANNANENTVHFSVQISSYRAVNCAVFESSDQNSGNTIDGFGITSSSVGISQTPPSASQTKLENCITFGCYRGFVGAGFQDVQIEGCQAYDYYATGFAFVAVNSGGSDYFVKNLMVSDCIAGHINTSSTVTAVGNVKLACFQFEQNTTAVVQDLSLSNLSANFDNYGAITPSGSASNFYLEGVTGVQKESNLVELGSQTSTGLITKIQETGTTVPDLSFGGGSTGIIYKSPGRIIDYTVSGGMMHFTGTIQLSSKGTDAGNAEITTNLPYTPDVSNDVLVPISTWSFSWTSVPSNATLYVDATGKINMRVSASSLTNITDANYGNATEIFFSGSFPVSV